MYGMDSTLRDFYFDVSQECFLGTIPYSTINVELTRLLLETPYLLSKYVLSNSIIRQFLRNR